MKKVVIKSFQNLDVLNEYYSRPSDPCHPLNYTRQFTIGVCFLLNGDRTFQFLSNPNHISDWFPTRLSSRQMMKERKEAGTKELRHTPKIDDETLSIHILTFDPYLNVITLWCPENRNSPNVVEVKVTPIAANRCELTLTTEICLISGKRMPSDPDHVLDVFQRGATEELSKSIRCISKIINLQ